MEKIQDTIKHFEEMIVTITILSNSRDEAPINNLIENRRGKPVSSRPISDVQIELKAEIPMSELLEGFNHDLKSLTRGYGSFEIEFLEFRRAEMDIMRVEIMDEEIDAFKFLVHKKRAPELGRKLVESFKEYIEKHLFQVKIQAKMGSKTIARETVKPRGKNVLAKCYGGDYSRKRKLIDKQKEGKAKMKQFGKVHIKNENLTKIYKSIARNNADS